MTDTLGETATQHIRATIAADPRDTRVEVDGVDVTGALVGISVHQTAQGGPPQVVLELSKGKVAPTVLEGAARVFVGEEPEPIDPGPAAAEFLAAIDAEELEKAALNRPDLGSEPYDLTKAMLAQLREWASGRP